MYDSNSSEARENIGHIYPIRVIIISFLCIGVSVSIYDLNLSKASNIIPVI